MPAASAGKLNADINLQTVISIEKDHIRSIDQHSVFRGVLYSHQIKAKDRKWQCCDEYRLNES